MPIKVLPLFAALCVFASAHCRRIPEPKPIPLAYAAARSGLLLRAEPTKKGAVLMNLPFGKVLRTIRSGPSETIDDVSARWIYVGATYLEGNLVKEREGWVFGGFVRNASLQAEELIIERSWTEERELPSGTARPHRSWQSGASVHSIGRATVGGRAWRLVIDTPAGWVAEESVLSLAEYRARYIGELPVANGCLVFKQSTFPNSFRGGRVFFDTCDEIRMYADGEVSITMDCHRSAAGRWKRTAEAVSIAAHTYGSPATLNISLRLTAQGNVTVEDWFTGPGAARWRTGKASRTRECINELRRYD